MGFPSPFTSSLPLIISMSLLLHSLGFLDPFTSSLPLFIFVGLLAINPTASTRWVCFLISLPFCPSFPSHFLYCQASSAIWPFINKWASTDGQLLFCRLYLKKCLIVINIINDFKKKIGGIVPTPLVVVLPPSPTKLTFNIFFPPFFNHRPSLSTLCDLSYTN